MSTGRVIASAVRRRYFPSTHEKNVATWTTMNGDRTLRVDYPLSSDSAVLDIGGYQGQWASDIFGRYCCPIAIFEPWPPFASGIKRRFARNPQITLHEYGLGARTRMEEMYGLGEGTSVFRHRESAESTQVSIRAVTEVWMELGLSEVDLMKVNIEGGEYELVPALVDAGLADSVRDIQIQFHGFVPDARARYLDLKQRLEKTHTLTYSVPFVWENWTLKG